MALIRSKFRLVSAKTKEVRDLIVRSAGPIVTEAMICAGDPKARGELIKDTCQGDSGGPLIANGPDGAPLQVGVVSWGEGCGIPKLYGIYARLGMFSDWVKSTAKP